MLRPASGNISAAVSFSASSSAAQQPVGRYIADFLCVEARLIVELDGGQHAESATDASRTAALEAAGYFVLRFWNHDVLGNTDGVLEVIANTLRIAKNAE